MMSRAARFDGTILQPWVSFRSVTVPLTREATSLLTLDAGLHIGSGGAAAASGSGLALLPAGASAAGRCFASCSIVHAFPPAAAG